MTLLQSLIAYFLMPIIGAMIFLILAQVILSWLVSFGVINLRHPAAASIYQIINRFVQPILSPIQRVIPSFGGLDFSPIVAILGLEWVRGYLLPMLFRALG